MRSSRDCKRLMTSGQRDSTFCHFKVVNHTTIARSRLASVCPSLFCISLHQKCSYSVARANLLLVSLPVLVPQCPIFELVVKIASIREPKTFPVQILYSCEKEFRTYLVTVKLDTNKFFLSQRRENMKGFFVLRNAVKPSDSFSLLPFFQFDV